MKTRPRLSFWQIWNMSFGFLGIQFGFALQNANVSRIFETLGAQVEAIPILWIAAPVTGLIVQPIVGYMSDNTWTRLGRRRPFFLFGAIGASVALVLLPTAPLLWIAVGIFWILGASIDMCMEPFRAFVGDMLPPEQRNRGFAMQSFFIGTGSVVASILPWFLTNVLSVANISPDGKVPPSVTISFLIGGIVFLAAIIITVTRTREYTPEQLREFEELEKGAERVKEDHKSSEILPYHRFSNPSIYWILLGIVLTFLVHRYEFIRSDLYILTFGFIIFGIIQFIGGHLIKRNKTDNGFVIVLNDLYRMPKTMGQLAVVQFFSWVGLFTLWTFATPGITSHHYDMKMSGEKITALISSVEMIDFAAADEEFSDRALSIGKDLDFYKEQLAGGKDQVVVSMRVVRFFQRFKSELSVSAEVEQKLLSVEQEYNRGANWVGFSFAIYNGVAAIFAFLIPFLAKWTNRRYTHAMALTMGALGYISVLLVPNPTWLIASMVGVGIAWASILAMPYAILTGSLPSHKMGTYMGLFNIFIVMPQIFAASVLGSFISIVAKGQPIFGLVFGGVSLFIAAIMMIFVVHDPDEELIKKRYQELDAGI
ncbi:MAG: MFS transporter [Bacteroidetes bacterium]|nr:MAG: MFS transporter [Bacteroidota bacterium]